MKSDKALRRSLEIALELAYTRSYVRDGAPQASGFAAYEAWIRALLDEDRSSKANAETVEIDAEANRWIYEVLIDARQSASRYLRSHAGDLGLSSKPHMLRAAELYQKMAVRLEAVRSDVPGNIPELGTNQAKASTQWTKPMRRSQVSALEQVVGLERQATSEIAQVLALK